MRFLYFILLSLTLLIPSCDALTVDWSVVDWTDGNESQSFNLGTGATASTVTFTIDEGNGSSSYAANGYVGAVPGDDTSVTLTGGFAGGESLVLAANHTGNTGYIDITISFNVEVYGVSFFIYDVDTWEGEWRDLVYDFDSELYGTNTGGPTLTVDGADNQLQAGGTEAIGRNPPGGVGGNDDDQFNANPTESGGNVYVDYGDTIITELTFRWKNEDSAQNNQYIGIGSTFYTVVPEASSVISLFVLFACTGMRRFRRKSPTAR